MGSWIVSCVIFLYLGATHSLQLTETELTRVRELFVSQVRTSVSGGGGVITLRELEKYFEHHEIALVDSALDTCIYNTSTPDSSLDQDCLLEQVHSL